jgi:lipoate-protein ligase A
MRLKPRLRLIQLDQAPILRQLELEEGLLRTEKESYCIINTGSSPAIVMGLSGKPWELLDASILKRAPIPVYRRFSGGGTVVVDPDTLFVTWIISQKDVPISPFPEPILRWTSAHFEQAWKIPHFRLVAQDFAIGDRKCGGNAQYIQKERWLHHTSFLWDYAPSRMAYLQQPPKQPAYRNNRSHSDFLCKLREFAPSKEALIDQLIHQLEAHFRVERWLPPTAPFLPHRRATHEVPLEELY